MKEGDYITYETCDRFVSSGIIQKIFKDGRILVAFGNGGRNMEYITEDKVRNG